MRHKAALPSRASTACHSATSNPDRVASMCDRSTQSAKTGAAEAEI
jgi:hypothetical protein